MTIERRIFTLGNCQCPKCGDRFISYLPVATSEQVNAPGAEPHPQNCNFSYKLKDGRMVTGCRRDYAGQLVGDE